MSAVALELRRILLSLGALISEVPLSPASAVRCGLRGCLPCVPPKGERHFIIGRPLNALPAPSLEESKENNLQRYARLEQIRQVFWRRWQREYISELQSRTKWRADTTRLNVGDLVLLHKDNVPPLNWRLGRVSRLFPGPDGISRVADINTMRGSVRRPLFRLCPLPTAGEIQA
ncbi:uncharacterized protein LOC126381358 [Pectinophora gossypiella]|uniref:uncharacterized protein LOC126381358 n=1 Tax=Pectinophora gossypiella TaxID=13191 RepID=UPI00214EDAB9|nr:uncharacterized protein LOC126381358 [Pectinophora gossypiella]